MQIVDQEKKGQDARDLTRQAAQWLHLFSFAAYLGAPVFSQSVCHYHSMLNPDASDSDRLAACRAMQKSVLRRLQVEELKGEARLLQDRPIDPYGLQLRTTHDGAVFKMIAHLLSHAIQAFEAEPQQV